MQFLQFNERMIAIKPVIANPSIREITIDARYIVFVIFNSSSLTVKMSFLFNPIDLRSSVGISTNTASANIKTIVRKKNTTEIIPLRPIPQSLIAQVKSLPSTYTSLISEVLMYISDRLPLPLRSIE